MAGATVYVAAGQFCQDDDAPRRRLAEAGFAVRENRLGRRLRGDELLEHVGEAEAVIAGVEPYDAALLAALPRLRCISRIGVGTDAIDLDAARQRGVAVLTTADEVAEPVAQMSVAMILALARNLPQHGEDFRRGRWTKRTGALLSEWTIGLIGFGRIGRAVARLLRPFGSRILASDPALESGAEAEGARIVGLDQLLAESDLVSLHAWRPQAEGPMLGGRELAAMKRGACVVNTARGHLIDESALLASLTSGHLAGAALDVFGEEPYRGPLAALAQVVCTPHVATLTRASRAAMERRAVENVIEFFRTMTSGERTALSNQQSAISASRRLLAAGGWLPVAGCLIRGGSWT